MLKRKEHSFPSGNLGIILDHVVRTWINSLKYLRYSREKACKQAIRLLPLFKFSELIDDRNLLTTGLSAEACLFIRPQMVLRIRGDRKWNGSGSRCCVENPFYRHLRRARLLGRLVEWSIRPLIRSIEANYIVLLSHLARILRNSRNPRLEIRLTSAARSDSSFSFVSEIHRAHSSGKQFPEQVETTRDKQLQSPFRQFSDKPWKPSYETLVSFPPRLGKLRKWKKFVERLTKSINRSLTFPSSHLKRFSFRETKDSWKICCKVMTRYWRLFFPTVC